MATFGANRNNVMAAIATWLPEGFDIFQGKTLFTAQKAALAWPLDEESAASAPTHHGCDVAATEMPSRPTVTTMATTPSANANSVQVTELYFSNGKRILNADQVLKQVRECVVTGNAQKGCCNLCFDDIDRRVLQLSACGRKACATPTCQTCLGGWYGGAEPGKLLNDGHLKCPFCKRPPAPLVLGKFNPRTRELVADPEAFADAGWYYAWCTDCNKPKKYMERVCAREAPEVDKFVCETCVDEARRAAERETAELQAIQEELARVAAMDEATRAVEEARLRTRQHGIEARILGRGDRLPPPALYKECPRCEVMTEKTMGCDHITCTSPGCDAHWCFTCRFLSTGNDAGEVYDHMYGAHGGMNYRMPDDDDEGYYSE